MKQTITRESTDPAENITSIRSCCHLTNRRLTRMIKFRVSVLASLVFLLGIGMPGGVAAVCGDHNATDNAEECDGTDLNSETCESLQGFIGGTLSCSSDCTFNTTDCAVCGDNNAETTKGEVCDGTDLNNQTCESLQGFIGGTLSCSSDCTFNTTDCAVCGDNNAETTKGEVCDGTDLGDETCQSQGFSTGTLSCSSDCSALDTSSCLGEGTTLAEAEDRASATRITLDGYFTARYDKRLADHNLALATTKCADATAAAEAATALATKTGNAYEQAVFQAASLEAAYNANLETSQGAGATPAEKTWKLLNAQAAWDQAIAEKGAAESAMSTADNAATTADEAKNSTCSIISGLNTTASGAGTAYTSARSTVNSDRNIPAINPTTLDFVYEDFDRDLVPNEFDACPTQMGLRKNSPDNPGPQDFCPSGCPELLDDNDEPIDSDLDGVLDCEDRCPFEGTDGISYTHSDHLKITGISLDWNGCKDSDGDQIPDIFDACPDQAGGACTSGCPDPGNYSSGSPIDSDGDGIPDCQDRCPKTYAVGTVDGCPDMDMDGVPDSIDYCMATPGSASFAFQRKLEANAPKDLTIFGCPDTDEDLVPDAADLCDAPVYPNQGPTTSNIECSTNFDQIGADIDGEATDDESGHSVAMSSDGSRIAIGAIYNDGNGSDSGHVRVYEFNSTDSAWSQIGADIDGEAAEDETGSSIAMSSDGSRIAIGAIYNDGNGSDSGHVRVYEFNSTDSAWSQIGADIDGEAADDESGWSVAMSSDGSRIAIGAPRNDGNGSDSGHVRVYEFNSTGSAWSQIGADIDGEAAEDESGSSVAMSSDGSRIAVGAIYNDGNGSDSGHVRVYEFNSTGSAWSQIGADIDGEAAEDETGSSVAMSSDGSRIAIGAPRNDGNGTNSGHVRVYDFISTDSTWSQIGADIDGEAADDFSGSSVAMSSDGSRIAIGAAINDGSGSKSSKSGHVRVYELDDSAWSQVGADIDSEAADDFSGSSVAMSSDGSRIAIGAPRNDGNNGSEDSGHVRVYQEVCPEVSGIRTSGAAVVDKTGCPLDSDNDSVFDGYDQCDSTVHSATAGHDPRASVYTEDDDGVDTNLLGCPKDTDKDGVVDGIDQCPTEGGYILSSGCPKDSDNDGIRDCISTSDNSACHSTTAMPNAACCTVERDFCATTPRGATAFKASFTLQYDDIYQKADEVIQSGCHYDSDTDGVHDGVDKCLGTTPTEIDLANSDSSKLTIDMKGCPILSANMWEPTVVDVTTTDSNGANPAIELLFSVNANLREVLEARQYDVSTQMVQAQIMDKTCQNKFDDVTATGNDVLPLTVNMNNQGAFTGQLPFDSIPITVNVNLNPDNVVGSPIWTTSSPYDVGSVDFCLSFAILSSNQEPVTVTELIATILLDMTQGFSVIGTSIERAKAEETTELIDIKYPIDACQCDLADVCVGKNALVDSFLRQSDSLKLCIRFRDAGNGLPPAYVEMMDVRNFACSQGGLTVTPIVDFERVGSGGQLTAITRKNDGAGENERMLTIDSRLPAAFFGVEERPVDCSGTIVYAFTEGTQISTNGRRVLAEASVSTGSASEAAAQRRDEVLKESSSDFSIDIVLAKLSKEGGPSAGAIAAAAVGSVAAIALAGTVVIVKKRRGISFSVQKRQQSSVTGGSYMYSPSSTDESVSAEHGLCA